MKLATFDIFDTCLIRKCGFPDVVPHLVALKLCPQNEMIRQEYVISRIQAAKKAGIHATIKDIYSQEPLQCLPNYSLEQIMQTEMEMEAEMLVTNNSIIKLGKLGKVLKVGKKTSITLKTLITFLRKEGWKVKFLSDMYLPSSFLESILIREGFIKVLKVNKDEKVDNSDNSNNSDNFSEHVIVSCEWGARKDSGDLFKKVKEKYHPEEWIHFGDNFRSDYKMARKNGVMAIRVNTAFSAIEKKVASLANNSRNQYQTKLLAGIMRYGRLGVEVSRLPQNRGGSLPISIDSGNKNVSAPIDLAADYITPLYIPFIAFVLKQARKMGIKRLYFLSRDGYIMHEIAKALNPIDIELKYLFVSRKALIPAFLLSCMPLSGGLREAFLKITDRQHLIGRTVDYLLGQLQLDRNELYNHFGIKFNFKKILNKKQQEEFLDKIFDNPQFTPHLISIFEEKKQLTLAYLSQEGLKVFPLGGDLEGASEGAAMVDIGWLGTTRLMINEIIAPPRPSPLGREGIPTFYLGVRGDVYPRSYGDYYSYFPYGGLSTEATGLIENYYSASPWPSTIGYQKLGKLVNLESCKEADYPLGRGDKEGIIPIFKEGEEFKMTLVIETNVKIAKEMAKGLKTFLDIIDEELLFQWAKITVQSLSSMEFSTDLTPMTKSSEFDGIPMVKKLSPIELCSLLLLGGRISAFDHGSLSHTIGHKLTKHLWKFNEISGRYRSLGYKVLLRLKNK